MALSIQDSIYCIRDTCKAKLREMKIRICVAGSEEKGESDTDSFKLVGRPGIHMVHDVPYIGHHHILTIYY